MDMTDILRANGGEHDVGDVDEIIKWKNFFFLRD